MKSSLAEYGLTANPNSSEKRSFLYYCLPHVHELLMKITIISKYQVKFLY